ncbi:MAG: NAD-dependent epimerase/dehydratase family protein [Actinobacteria bacterium]|nr:NAD-dependent epimerase/dehydratase family protein [Actinomycetota bacterium]
MTPIPDDDLQARGRIQAESDSRVGAELADARVLVTGARGFIGGHLVPRLVSLGADTHCCSRQPTPGARRAVWHQCELTDSTAVGALMASVRPDVVIPLASAVTGTRARTAVLPILEANLLAAVNVMALMPDHARLVLAGSMEEPGTSDEPPGSPYAAAKFAASAYGRMFQALYDLPIVNLRIFMVYGPGQADRTKLIPATIDALAGNHPPRIGSGARPVDWVYVGDVLRAVILAATVPGAVGARVDVGTGQLHTVRDVVERLTARIAPSITPSFGAIPDRPLEASPVADVARTASLLGWAPETSLDEGLRLTVEAERGLAPSRSG